MKRRETDAASNQFPKGSPPPGTQKFTELGRVERGYRRDTGGGEKGGGEKGESKEGDSSQASNLAP